MSKRKINFLGFLSLLSLIAILGYTSENKGLYGFLGFLSYLRYFKVVPDELFIQNVQRAATFAFMSELMTLLPILFLLNIFKDIQETFRISFGLSFAIAIITFSVAMVILEWQDMKGLSSD